MKWVVSRYNHRMEWIQDYIGSIYDVYLYDRSDKKPEKYRYTYYPNYKKALNLGSDLFDKFSFIIENYDNLPEIAVYTKANLFDYIKPREFEKIKDNKVFTPILSQDHHTYEPTCFYKDGLYYEINNYWYLNEHPAKYAKEIVELFKMEERAYNGFAPGSNYILTREDIRKHPKALYETLRSYLDWAVYPGDAQLLERNLYYLWK